MSGDDILLWPCGTWCYANEIAEFSFMSDDYERLSPGEDRYKQLAEDEFRAGPAAKTKGLPFGAMF